MVFICWLSVCLGVSVPRATLLSCHRVCERPGLEFWQQPPPLAHSLRPSLPNRQICDQSPQSHGRDAAPSGPAEAAPSLQAGGAGGPPRTTGHCEAEDLPRKGGQSEHKRMEVPRTAGWGTEDLHVRLGARPHSELDPRLKTAGGCSEPEGVGGHRLGGHRSGRCGQAARALGGNGLPAWGAEAYRRGETCAHGEPRLLYEKVAGSEQNWEPWKACPNRCPHHRDSRHGLRCARG